MSKRWWRPARLVFLTVHEDADFARAALDAGGLGYVVQTSLKAGFRATGKHRSNSVEV